jgi:hypothetical protein
MYLTFITAVTLLLLLLRLINSAYLSITSPLRSIPGPLLARFSKLWYLWRVYHGHFEQDNIELHRKYGKEPPRATRRSPLLTC